MQRTISAFIKEGPMGPFAKAVKEISSESARLSRNLTRKVVHKDRTIIEQYMAQHRSKKLHLGCGNNLLDGWLNSDYSPRSNGVVYTDATQTFPFGDEVFDFVFSEHMIEHIPYAKGNQMLRESFRVLKDGGKIRITTPDLAFLISLYRTDKSELQQQYLRQSPQLFPNLYPSGQDTFIINGFVREWGHTFIYDEKVLRASLEAAGFKQITRVNLNQSESAELRCMENESRMPEGFLQLESFTLEGTKKVTGAAV